MASQSIGNNFQRILIIVLLLLVCFLSWKTYTLSVQLANKETLVNELSDEQRTIKADLEATLAQYDAMVIENDSIRAEVEAEKAKIEKLLNTIKNYKWDVHKLKKEAETLRTIMQGFVETIDSLNTLNIELRAENAEVRSSLSYEQRKNSDLVNENKGLSEKVQIASALKAYSIRSAGIRVADSNVGRETTKAKKTDKLRLYFTLAKNDVTEPGKKTLYMRILDPLGKVLSISNEDVFSFNGVQGLYSVKKEIDYENKEIVMTMDWKKTEEFIEGEYVFTLYESGIDIGKSKLLLK